MTMIPPRRSVSVALAAVALMVTASIPSPARSAVMYQVTDLGILPIGYEDPVFNASNQVTSGMFRMSDGAYSIENGAGTVPGEHYRPSVSYNGVPFALLTTQLRPSAFYDTIFANAVNKNGMVVGDKEDPSYHFGPTGFFYTQAGGMKAVPEVYPSPNAASWANSVNDAGMIVGWATGPKGGSNPTTVSYIAFLSNGQTSWDLNTLIQPGSGLMLGGAYDINDLGQITAIGVDSKNQDHIVLLTPIPSPEPGAWMILAAGAVGFGGRRAFRRQAVDLPRPNSDRESVRPSRSLR